MLRFLPEKGICQFCPIKQKRMLVYDKDCPSSVMIKHFLLQFLMCKSKTHPIGKFLLAKLLQIKLG